MMSAMTQVEIVGHLLPFTVIERKGLSWHVQTGGLWLVRFFPPLSLSPWKLILNSVFIQANALFHGSCSQISVCLSLLQLSESVYLHNWCVSDRGM